MKKLSLGKENKTRKQVSLFVVWTKEELNKPLECRMKFSK